MRCGAIFSVISITFFPDFDSEKKFENWSIFDEVSRRTKSVCQIFWATLYINIVRILYYLVLAQLVTRVSVAQRT